MIIHVLPGDAQVEPFRNTGIEGEIVVCREAFVDGDVSAGSLDEFWSVREKYLAEAYPESTSNYREKVITEFEKLADLPATAKVNLWFEYELFCHVNMWFCLWLLRDSRAGLYRVAPVAQRKDEVWSGFGNLTPDELRECYEERLEFTDPDINLGVELWTAFQDRNYPRLKELSTTRSGCFPYLEEACDAEIEKEVRPKQILRELQREGVDDPDEMFAAFRRRAGVYGFGDTQVKRILNEI